MHSSEQGKSIILNRVIQAKVAGSSFRVNNTLLFRVAGHVGKLGNRTADQNPVLLSLSRDVEVSKVN